MTFSNLRSHPLYDLLDSRHKMFIDMYLSSKGSMTKAIKHAFPNVKNVAAYSLKLQKNDTIAALLDFIDNDDKPNVEELRRILWRTIKASTGESVIIKGAELLAKLLDSPSDEDRQKQKIQEGKRIDGLRSTSKN